MPESPHALSKYDTNAALFKAKRLIQIFYATELAFFSAFVVQSFVNFSGASQVILLAGMLIISPVKFLATRGNIVYAASLLLITVTVIVSLLVMRYDGLKDVAIMAYPGILLFSVMIGGGRLFLVLLSLMSSVIVFVAVSNVTGFHVNVVSNQVIPDAILTLIIIFVIGYSVWLWSNDLRLLFEKLESENKKFKKSQLEIEYIAQHDALTHLPNRLLAKDRFKQCLLKAKREGSSVALLYIDLDNFKEINDTLGHTAGDEFLKVVSDRLKNLIREYDTVSRQGGDEFLIILDDIKHSNVVVSIADKISSAIAKAITINNNNLEVSGSIGIAIYPEDGDNYDALLQKSDLAMFHAKETGKNNFKFYNDDLTTNLTEYLTLVAELKVAIAESQFELYYQPKVSLTSNSISGAEALIRWNHPRKGLIYPDEFISVAEKSGLIVEIGRWVINTACRHCKQWQDDGYAGVTVAVNVSSIQFSQDDIYTTVLRALDASNLSGNQLELEITESLLLDDSALFKNTVDKISALGVMTSIDDFGTGYSNLRYLKHFKISFIKIDRSFIKNIDINNEDRAIVIAITQLAHSLNMKIIAEGIETEDILNQISSIGCDYAQGYFWSKPIPLNSFIDVLTRV